MSIADIKNTLTAAIRSRTRYSLHLFTQYMGVNSPSELLELHLKTKDEHLIEDKLEEFAQIRKINKLYAQFVKGFFRANRKPLSVYIDNHTP